MNKIEPFIFNNNKTQISLSYCEKPVINIIKINFSSEDKQWVDRLFNANLIVKISALDNEDNELISEQTPLSFASYITPSHNQPLLEINQIFKLSNDSSFQNLAKPKNWKIEINLNNLKFNTTEFISCDYMDTAYINRRVSDWQNRVSELIQTLKEWTKDNPIINILASRKQKMHEGMMKTFEVPMREIESADIQKNGKTVIVLKSFGLWVMGANGRVDLLTATGNFVLVDQSDAFEKPRWNLYLKNNKKQGVEFTKESFNQLLGL